MRVSALRERVLFALFLAAALTMVAVGWKIEQVPETLFNATLV